MNSIYWKNKNVVITGGSSGLGRELAISLSKQGANVVAIARRLELLERLKFEVPNIEIIQSDVADKECIHSLAFEIYSKLQDVDLLFNVASYLGESPLKMLVDTECEDFEKVLQTNLLGPFRLSKLLLSNMILNKNGTVVNISSDAAINAYERWGSYGVSKAAIDHMSRIFDEELKGQGVRFLSVDPGDMNTPMHFAAIPDANPDELKSAKDSAELLLKLLVSKSFSEVRRILWNQQ